MTYLSLVGYHSYILPKPFAEFVIHMSELFIRVANTI